MLGHMVRLRPDGSQLTWRVATMSKFDEPGRAPKPFFITWDDPALRPDKVTYDGSKGRCQQCNSCWVVVVRLVPLQHQGPLSAAVHAIA